MVVTSSVKPSSSSTATMRAPVAASRSLVSCHSAMTRPARSRAPGRCAVSQRSEHGADDQQARARGVPAGQLAADRGLEPDSCHLMRAMVSACR